ncbi:WD40-repeat-containing domain protein, partial [Aspergillus novoparasiticus]
MFRCPCCCQTLPAEFGTDENLWKKHLAEDISPYTCILPDCPNPCATFATAFDWEKHSKSEHRPCRLCPLCENAENVFSNLEDLARHIEIQHTGAGSPDFVLTAISLSGVTTIGVSHCPLCDSTGPEYAPEFIQHVLGCIHDFSLYSLPWAGSDHEKTGQHTWTCDLKFVADTEQPIRQWFENGEVEENKTDSILGLDLRECDKVQVHGSDPTNNYFSESKNEYFDLASARDSLEVLKDATSTENEAKDESGQSHGAVNTVGFSPDGWILATISHDYTHTICLRDVATGALQQTLKGHSSSVSGVAFSPNGRILASASYDCTIRLWDVATGVLQRTLKGHSDFISTILFSPDGRILASASYDCTVQLWDVVTGALQQRLKGHSSSVSGVAFSPNGRILASASYDSTIRLWDVATGVLQQTLKGHSDFISTILFSPDGRILASASYDCTVRLWDVATGVLRQTLKGYSNFISPIIFSPDGRILVSASYDCTVRLWDVVTGALCQTLKGHSNFVSTAFLSDPELLASASEDGRVQLWDTTTGAQLQTKADVLGRQSILPPLVLKSMASRLDDKSYNVRKAALNTLGHQSALPFSIL